MKPFWNERYAQSDYVYGEEPNRFFKKMLDSPELSGLSGKSMLLPCEGEGRNAVYAASFAVGMLLPWISQNPAGRRH
jgi:hypothetical protein